MSFKRTELSASLLDGVLPEYKKISQAPDNSGDHNFYKAIDQRSGEVYLVKNPASWAVRIESNGRTTLIRPLAVSKGHINSLPKQAGYASSDKSSETWGGF